MRDKLDRHMFLPTIITTLYNDLLEGKKKRKYSLLKSRMQQNIARNKLEDF